MTPPMRNFALQAKHYIRSVLLAGMQLGVSASQQDWCSAPVFKPIVIASLWLYRATLSHLVGRDCLFAPTCSQRALTALRNLPFKAAMLEIREQVLGCNPNYNLRSTVDGWVMVTSNGRTYAATQLSAPLCSKLSELQTKAHAEQFNRAPAASQAISR